MSLLVGQEGGERREGEGRADRPTQEGGRRKDRGGRETGPGRRERSGRELVMESRWKVEGWKREGLKEGRGREGKRAAVPAGRLERASTWSASGIAEQ